jgi:hypothetical protein
MTVVTLVVVTQIGPRGSLSSLDAGRIPSTQEARTSGEHSSSRRVLCCLLLVFMTVMTLVVVTWIGPRGSLSGLDAGRIP